MADADGHSDEDGISLLLCGITRPFFPRAERDFEREAACLAWAGKIAPR